MISMIEIIGCYVRSMIPFLLLLLVSCDNGNKISSKPLKYINGGLEYSCDGQFEKNRLKRIECYNRDSILIIEHDYKTGSENSSVRIFYNTGELKEEGNYLRSNRVGVWKCYYESHKLKEYNFYKLQETMDTSFLIYKKQYDEVGDMIASYIPVEVRKDSLPKVFNVGQSYDLYIDLLYSEFDSVKSAGILESSPMSSLEADSSIFQGSSLYYNFTPKEKGRHTISGTYFEMDAKKEYKDERTIAERPFSFSYMAE